MKERSCRVGRSSTRRRSSSRWRKRSTRTTRTHSALAHTSTDILAVRYQSRVLEARRSVVQREHYAGWRVNEGERVRAHAHARTSGLRDRRRYERLAWREGIRAHDEPRCSTAWLADNVLVLGEAHGIPCKGGTILQHRSDQQDRHALLLLLATTIRTWIVSSSSKNTSQCIKSAHEVEMYGVEVELACARTRSSSSTSACATHEPVRKTLASRSSSIASLV